jgi:hypothetical protein
MSGYRHGRKPELISTEIGTVERNGFEADVGCSCLELAKMNQKCPVQ